MAKAAGPRALPGGARRPRGSLSPSGLPVPLLGETPGPGLQLSLWAVPHAEALVRASGHCSLPRCGAPRHHWPRSPRERAWKGARAPRPQTPSGRRPPPSRLLQPPSVKTPASSPAALRLEATALPPAVAHGGPGPHWPVLVPPGPAPRPAPSPRPAPRPAFGPSPCRTVPPGAGSADHHPSFHFLVFVVLNCGVTNT